MSSAAPIRPLSDNVINQIAAGEVIERPASIVKELLENSLDAGATRIHVELTDGGIDAIHIRDDGHGIAADQLQLALSRHCTSKLVEAAELAAIRSLGFRGEALASIAAVADVAITSRTAEDVHGWRIEMRAGGAATCPRAVQHAPGTTIEVHNLFSATPARRRFLKRPRTEFLHVQQLVRRAGFCYPEVSFGLMHDGRQNLILPLPRHAAASDRRWRTLFGAEFSEHAQHLDVTTGNLRVSGWVCEARYSRQNSDLQYLAVNRRIVRDRHIAHAVRMAYEGQLEEGRYAAYALHVELPATEVDVNVHPGKAEVRLADPRTVHDIVYAAVKQALAGGQEVATDAYLERGVTSPSLGVAETHSEARQSVAAPARKAHPAPSAESLLTITANRFALLNEDGALSVMDLHDAIRIVVRGRLARGEHDARPLIVPEAVRLSLADGQLETLAGLGVEFGRLSPHSAALRMVPVAVSEIDPAAFAAALVDAVKADSGEVDAIACAAALAFRAPPALAECRRWFAGLEHRLAELSLTSANFSVVLGADVLSGLFAGRRR